MKKSLLFHSWIQRPFISTRFLIVGQFGFLLLKWLNNQKGTENIYDLIQIKTKRNSSRRETVSIGVTFRFELRI